MGRRPARPGGQMSDIGRYRKLFIRIWCHPDFAELTEGEKNLALYLLTGPQSNRLGIFGFSLARAGEELGMSPETVRKRLVTVCGAFGWFFDGRARVVYIPSWWRWNPPENPNVMKGNLKDLNEVPPSALVDAFARNIDAIPGDLQEMFVEGLRQRLPKRSRKQEQEQGTETGRHKQKQKPFAAERKDVGDLSDELLKIALRVVEDTPRADKDYLIDAIQNYGLQNNLTVTRQEAVAAIAVVMRP